MAATALQETLELPRVLAAPAQEPPRLADGVELIGRFEDSGFKEPPYIARRADGQVVQMAPLLYALAEEVDERRSHAEIAERLSHRIERGVTGEMAEMLIEKKLRPLGIVAPPDGATDPELRKVDPLLALRLRTKVVPERVVRAVTFVFQPLFAAPVVALALAAFVALDVWLFALHGISQSLRHTLYQPALLLLLIGGVIVATAFHEIGHATACRYGGANPGVMGVGIYIVWPAFYTDVTDSYRLGKRGRLRTDLGGMYFNAIFALIVAAFYFVTRFEPLLLLVVLQTFTIVQQSLPFLRLDGYYVISDLTGVPDIFTRIKPVLLSLIPRRAPDRRVTELKPWVRVPVTAYVLTLVPVVGFILLMMLINAPRVFATGYDSFLVHWDRLGPDFGSGATTAQGFTDLLQAVVLFLPALGLAYTTGRIGRRAGVASWHWSAGDAVRRGVVIAAGAGLAGLMAFLWWPQGEYRPIQPGERGTIFSGLGSIAKIPTGRPALTPQRQIQLRGAPMQYQLDQARMRARSKQARTGLPLPKAPLEQKLMGLPPSGGTVTLPDSGTITSPSQTGSTPTGTAPTTTSPSQTDTSTTPTDTQTTGTTDTSGTGTDTGTTSTTQTQTSTTPTDTQTTTTGSAP